MQGLENIVAIEDLRQAIAFLKEKLDKEVEKDRADKIAIAKEIISSLQLRPEDLDFGFFTSKTAKEKKQTKSADGQRRKRRTSEEMAAAKQALKAKAKYRDEATGIEWCGEGRKPNYFKGKDMSAYLIK